MNQLSDDIRERIRVSFPDDVALVESTLGSIASARVVRCVLHLAGEDLNKLGQMHAASQQDCRDVIWWAEYDHPKNPEVRVRDFHQPFGQSMLK